MMVRYHLLLGCDGVYSVHIAEDANIDYITFGILQQSNCSIFGQTKYLHA